MGLRPKTKRYEDEDTGSRFVTVERESPLSLLEDEGRKRMT